MAECHAPGASAAKVATFRGIDADVVYRWGQLAREGGQASAASQRELVAISCVAQAASQAQAGGDIEFNCATAL